MEICIPSALVAQELGLEQYPCAGHVELTAVFFRNAECLGHFIIFCCDRIGKGLGMPYI